MFDVILVTQKNMMTTSGTHTQGLHSTQVRHHSQIDLLTCCGCFVKHMLISTQVHHHTHFDLTTWHVCFVKHMMIMYQYFPRFWYDPYPLYARGLCLCLFFQCAGLWSAAKTVVWWLLVKVHSPKSIAVTILTINVWEDTRPIWCLSYPSGAVPLIPGNYDSW